MLRLDVIRDALGGCDRVTLEMDSEAKNYQDWRSTWSRSISRRWIGKEVCRELILYLLVNLLLWQCRELSTTRSAKRWEMRLAGSGR